jgi:flagellar basal-body rod protein FlgC
MNLFGVMDVSASALRAERVRAEVVASNMANAETTRTPEGGPYQRHHVVFEAEGGDGSFQQSLTSQMNGGMSNGLSGGGLGSGFTTGLNGGWSGGLSSGVTAANGTPGGVEVAGVISDRSAPLERYDPQDPDAGPDGFVAYPDINPLTEMVDLMGATRSYGMNASAVQAEKNMVTSSLDILK